MTGKHYVLRKIKHTKIEVYNYSRDFERRGGNKTRDIRGLVEWVWVPPMSGRAADDVSPGPPLPLPHQPADSRKSMARPHALASQPAPGKLRSIYTLIHTMLLMRWPTEGQWAACQVCLTLNHACKACMTGIYSEDNHTHRFARQGRRAWIFSTDFRIRPTWTYYYLALWGKFCPSDLYGSETQESDEIIRRATPTRSTLRHVLTRPTSGEMSRFRLSSQVAAPALRYAVMATATTLYITPNAHNTLKLWK